MLNVVGTKYEATRDLDIAEVAKLIRSDLKRCGIPKGTKVSVRISRFSMGQSLYLTITTTEPSEELMSSVRAIAEAYNFDNSDPMTDYYSTRFFLHVQWNSK